MSRCSALSLLGSESPLRGRKSSPKALQSVLKKPPRIYKLFRTLPFAPMTIPLLQRTTEMCPYYKESSRSRTPGLIPLAGAGFVPLHTGSLPLFPRVLLGLVHLGWAGACTCTMKPRQCHQSKAVLSTPWSSNKSWLHLIPKRFPNDHMKTFFLPLGSSILGTSFVKCVLSPMKTLQIHQSVFSPPPLWHVGTMMIQESQNKQKLVYERFSTKLT